MLRRQEGWRCSLAVLFVLVLGSCADKPGGQEGKSERAADEKILARVGKRVITEADFEREIASLPEYSRRQMETPEQKKKRLDRMIDDLLLMEEAQRRGLDRDQDILAKVERYRQRLMTEKLYQQVAEERGKIDEEEIRSYYESHKDQFSQKERVRARQILILVPPNAPPEKEKEAEAKAREAQVRAQAGEDFLGLAKQYSDAPDPVRASELGYFSKGRMPPEFDEAAFALQNPGDVSDVVRTRLGFHVIQLLDRQPAKEQPLEEIRDRIVRILRSQKTRDVRQGLAAELRGKAQIEIEESFLRERAGDHTGQGTAYESEPPESSLPILPVPAGEESPLSEMRQEQR